MTSLSPASAGSASWRARLLAVYAALACLTGAAAAEPALTSTLADPPPDGGPGEPAPAPVVGDGSSWRAEFNTWIWLVGLDGNTGIGSHTVEVDASFGDVLEKSDSVLAFSGRLEIGKGRWGAFLDGMYSDLGVEDQTGPLGATDVDSTFQMTILDIGLMYRVAQWEPEGEALRNARKISLDLYAGARYTNLDVEVSPARVASRAKNVDWVDPIVGAKFVLPIAERWSLQANADVGGFGAASDFTWSATAVVRYDFFLGDHPFALFAGYRAIGQDYSDGDGAEKFTWDMVQYGPMFGFSILF
jgi:hypothetical protein